MTKKIKHRFGRVAALTLTVPMLMLVFLTSTVPASDDFGMGVSDALFIGEAAAEVETVAAVAEGAADAMVAAAHASIAAQLVPDGNGEALGALSYGHLALRRNPQTASTTQSVGLFSIVALIGFGALLFLRKNT